MEWLTGMIRYFWTKILATVPLCFLSFEQTDIDIVWGIIYIVILDTILGMWVGLKFRRFSSNRLSRMATKTGRYGMAMACVWVLSSVEPAYFGWLFHYVGYFIIITELLSNFEKLSLLGFRLPTKLISKLNKDFERFYNVKDGETREAIAKTIIDNRDCRR